MGNRIQQLPPEVANQIAAGEVIERPASVVKELLENSLDAQASVIHIEIEFGGLSSIKISDNGHGIQEEDLPLALAAHATSKIAQLIDLYSLHSMGFRGEALASIASIANVSISSKPENQTHAMTLRKLDTSYCIEPSARTSGTTIVVRDLFYNAPVRKKFLKSAKAEFLAIDNIVRRIALSAPEVELHLKHNGLAVLELPAANSPKSQLLRLQKLLGKNFVAAATHLDVEMDGMELSGWVSGINYQRSQNDKLWVYVNKRMVKDKLILHAVKQAYEGLLHTGRFPACVLYLTVPTQEVDVNVHPTKHEVRFQQPRHIHDFISSQIARALACATYPDEKLVKKHNPLLLNETYSPQFESSVSSFQKNSSWIIINSKVVLVFIEKNPFLVSVEKLQKHYFNNILQQKSIPFETRPVLVPMTFLVQDGEGLIEHYQKSLLQFGIVVDLVSERTVIVRNLPIVLPFLNCSLLLERLDHAKPRLDSSEILNLLIDCNLSDAQQLDPDQEEELYAYLSVLTSSSKDINWCLHLDIERCRELMHV
jgi:DNA mismatch repair protein MutL